MIQASNINWSTVKAEPTAMPIAFSRTAIGYGMYGEFYRVGNIVFVSNTATCNRQLARQSDTSLSETIPEGFRPYKESPYATSIVGTLMYDGGSSNTCTFSWSVFHSGAMRFYCPKDIGATGNLLQIGISGVWFTTDPWPTS